jgi:hypothetical protein
MTEVAFPRGAVLRTVCGLICRASSPPNQILGDHSRRIFGPNHAVDLVAVQVGCARAAARFKVMDQARRRRVLAAAERATDFCDPVCRRVQMLLVGYQPFFLFLFLIHEIVKVYMWGRHHFDVIVRGERPIAVAAVMMLFGLVLATSLLCRPGFVADRALPGKMVHGLHVLPPRGVAGEIPMARVALPPRADVAGRFEWFSRARHPAGNCFPQLHSKWKLPITTCPRSGEECVGCVDLACNPGSLFEKAISTHSDRYRHSSELNNQ